MKVLFATVALALSPMIALANPHGLNQGHMEMLNKLQNMSPEEQQKFMMDMQKKAMGAQACLGQIDPAQMQALQTKGEAISARVDALCKQGKPKDAEAYAMREGQKMMADPLVKKMRSCSADIVKDMDFLYPENQANGTSKSICD